MTSGREDPQTKEDITWDPEEGPSYNPPSDGEGLSLSHSDSDEPLDWGTEEDEEYVLSSLTRTPVHALPASPQFLSESKSQDGLYRML